MYILIYFVCLFICVIGSYIIYKNEDDQILPRTLGELLKEYGFIMIIGIIPVINIPGAILVLIRITALKFGKSLYKIFKKISNIKI